MVRRRRLVGRNRAGYLGLAIMVSLAATFATPARSASPPDSPVADAAELDDVKAVRALLRQGADVNAAQGDGMTALHWAAENGNVELTKILLSAGANVAAVTRIGDHTPLHLASRVGHASVIRALLKAGADPNATTTTGGATPLHFAAGPGGAEAVTVLLHHGADVNATESSWGQTPIMWAAAYNRVDAIAVLVQRGADAALTTKVVDIPVRSEADRAAARRRDQVLAAFRAEQGPNWRPAPSQVQAAVQAAKQTPGAAAEESDLRNKADAAFRTELGPAADSTQRPQARREQRPQGDPSAAQAEPSQPAPREGRPDSYADLVGTHGGLTALLHAVREGNVDASLALVDAGADINQVSAGDHTSPLLMATINGHFDLALVLLERGADPNLASDAGATPLYTTINMQWAPKARYPQQQAYTQQRATYLEVMKALLDAGADPNVRLAKHLWYMSYTFDLLGVDTKGATPFWRAAYALDVEAMRLLVAYGADPTIATQKVPERRYRRRRGNQEEKDHSGLPPVPVGGPAVYPIHAASGVGYGEGYAANAHRHVPDHWVAAVKYLVEEHGADVNARDLNGFTPLHHAAARGDNELIHYLVGQGADVTAVSRQGQTTADMANGPVQRVQPFPETVKLLESLGSKNNHNCLSC